MSSPRVLRQVRRLSTTATEANVSTTTATANTAEAAISKLRSEHDPDKAVKIYSTVSNKHYMTSPNASSHYTLDLTVKRLAKARRFNQIIALINSHKCDANIKQEPFLTSLIRSYGVAGMFGQALKLYNQMDEFGTPRSVVSFNGLLFACNNSKFFGRVPHLFDEIPQRYNFLPDKVSYGLLIKAYCALGCPDLGIERLREMEEKGVEITAITFTTILHSLYKKGSVDEAERIWNEMVSRGCLLDVGAYNVRIMQAQGGEPEGVKTLIGEMCRAGLKPDTVTYNYLITCYCKNKMMDEAMKVYEGLEGNGCVPNATTFRTLVYYMCRYEMFEDAYRVFETSVDANQIPNFETLRHLAEGLVKLDNRKDAKALICTVKERFPRSSLLNAWKKLEKELGLLND